MRVLLVEDNHEKAAEISRAVRELGKDIQPNITTAVDLVSAKRNLSESSYDILLLDIRLPIRFGEGISPDGGARLLEEIVSSTSMHRPRYIVGLTAYDDILEAARPVFAENLFALIRFEPNGEEWKSHLRKVISHAQAASSAPVTSTRSSADLVLICALDSPELRAVLDLPMNWESIVSDNDSLMCHQGKLTLSSRDVSVIAASCPQMGMAATAVIATRLVEQFRPKAIGMTGIAGGRPGATNFGDVIVVDPSWDCTSGKRKKLSNGSVVFQPDPRQIRLDPLLEMQFRVVAAQEGVLDSVRSRWRGEKPDTALQIRFGPLASGGTVIDDPGFWTHLEQQNRKVLGIDLEAYGVFCAAMYAKSPQPKAFVIKSVSDDAVNKDDRFRAYAAYTSASFLYEWLKRFGPSLV